VCFMCPSYARHIGSHSNFNVNHLDDANNIGTKDLPKMTTMVQIENVT
jgi:hypothetical protein